MTTVQDCVLPRVRLKPLDNFHKTSGRFDLCGDKTRYLDSLSAAMFVGTTNDIFDTMSEQLQPFLARCS